MSDLPPIGQEPDWRAQAISKLQRYGLRVVNPIDWAIPLGEEPEGVEKRVRRALDLIDQCDALLANLHRSNHGTAMEIFYAHRRGKMVTVVGNSPFSPWVVSHSQARFADVDPALNYLIAEGLRTDVLNWTLQFESQLTERYEQYPPSGEPDYQFFGAELPVLIFAPHATGYFREGEFCEPEIFTGALAAGIHRAAGCHSLISSYCLAADPCRYLETPMIRALADVVKSGQIGFVMLVLGMSWHEANGFVLEAAGPDADVVSDLANRLKLKLSVLGDVASRENEEDLQLLNFIANNLSVPVIGLRVHRRFRMPRLQPEAFILLNDVLSDFAQEIGVELLRSAS
ncbi:MAG: nucleoside 2-deoxyribosyltransferase [Candidatus Obscuribacterales bacterium]|nr:nucleoside 2-deoxyribosyltransferase [Candidatus Obscuribacterales bacterium]